MTATEKIDLDGEPLTLRSFMQGAFPKSGESSDGNDLAAIGSEILTEVLRW